jgi:succinate dehydrogenase/fumarate reductase-like Fe-S protein
MSARWEECGDASVRLDGGDAEMDACPVEKKRKKASFSPLSLTKSEREKKIIFSFPTSLDNLEGIENWISAREAPPFGEAAQQQRLADEQYRWIVSPRPQRG